MTERSTQTNMLSTSKYVFRLLLLLMCFPIFLVSQQSFAISNHFQGVLLPQDDFRFELSPYVDVYYDETNEKTLDQIRSALLAEYFIPISEDRLHLPSSEGSYWVRFQIQNPHPEPQTVIVYLYSPFIDQMDFYHPKNGRYQAIQTGLERAQVNLFSDNTTFALPVSIPAFSTQAFFIRLNAFGPLRVNLELMSPLAYVAQEKQSHWLSGIGIGGVIAVTLFAFITFRRYNDAAHGALAAYTLLMLIFQLTWGGYLTLLFDGIGTWTGLALNFSVVLLPAAYGHLLRKIGRFDRVNILIPQYFLAVFAIFCLLVDQAWMRTSAFIVYLVAGIYISYLYWVRGEGIHRRFVMVHGIALLFALLGILSAFDIINNDFIAFYIGEIITTLEAIIFAILLSRHRQKLLIKQGQTDDRKSAMHQSELISKLSHDLRTPLNGVLGMAELLEESPLTHSQKDYLQTITNSGKDLLQLVNRMSDISKVETGRIELDDKQFNLHLLLKNTLAQYQHMATNKHIELVLDIDESLPEQVSGDPQRLETVFVNLLNNAFHYTEQGEIQLCASYNEHAGLFDFQVRDSGIGISQKEQQKLFAPYKVLDTDHRQQHAQSAGIGLTLCQQLVLLMGGRIGVDSTPGVGSNFYFDIKLNILAQLEPSSEQIQLQNLKVLIVDDNSTFRKLLSRYAQQWGMNADATYSGKEALAMLRTKANINEPYSIVIIDQDMPVMDGTQLAERIREDERINKNLIKVMLTGMSMASTSARARAAGINRVVTKPISSKQLKQILGELVSRGSSSFEIENEQDYGNP